MDDDWELSIQWNLSDVVKDSYRDHMRVSYLLHTPIPFLLLVLCKTNLVFHLQLLHRISQMNDRLGQVLFEAKISARQIQESEVLGWQWRFP